MNLRNLDAPDSVTYLNQVKEYLQEDLVSFSVFLQQVKVLLNETSSSPLTRAIVAVANILRNEPSLFRSLNSLLRNGDRIECPNTSQVTFFVLITASSARICSSSPNPHDYPVPKPSTTAEVLEVVASRHGWNRIIAHGHSKEYLTCLSQLLQVILDDLNTETVDKATVYRCLRELGDMFSILPPSIFLNHIKHEGQPLHAKQGGASSDIFKSVIKGTAICFRVLRMFDVPQDERDELYKKFCKEVLVWRQLRHPNVLPFLGANTESFRPQFCFISYWMNNGNIMSYLKKNPEHDRLAAINDIVAGIDYLHHLDPPVTHNDLKGANVLVTDDLTCCLADFGLSSILESQRLGNKSPTLTGSICWMAPELMTAGEPNLNQGLRDTERKVDRKAGDIFALGCTIFEIYTEKPPHYNCPNLANVIYAVSIERRRPQLPPSNRIWSDTEMDMWWVVDQCWAHEPSKRPEIHLVKANLEGLMVKKKTLEMSQRSTSETEWVKAQNWIQTHMQTMNYRDEGPKVKNHINREVSSSGTGKPRMTVLTEIKLNPPAQSHHIDLYPTPISPVALHAKQPDPPSGRQGKFEVAPANSIWKRIRPPSPHPLFVRNQTSGLPSPPTTPAVSSAPPVPSTPPAGSGAINCPLDLDIERRTTSLPQRRTPRRAHTLKLTQPSRLRHGHGVVVESDYEDGISPSPSRYATYAPHPSAASPLR